MKQRLFHLYVFRFLEDDTGYSVVLVFFLHSANGPKTHFTGRRPIPLLRKFIMSSDAVSPECWIWYPIVITAVGGRLSVSPLNF